MILCLFKTPCQLHRSASASVEWEVYQWNKKTCGRRLLLHVLNSILWVTLNWGNPLKISFDIGGLRTEIWNRSLLDAKHDRQPLTFFLLPRLLVWLINHIRRSQRIGKKYFTDSSSTFLYSYAMRHVTQYRRVPMRPNWTIFWFRRWGPVQNYARESKNVKKILVSLKFCW
jgi:hypothetical protein